jgi:hypothetical protein
MDRRALLPLVSVAALGLAACGDADSRGADGYAPDDPFCYGDADCPTGLVCRVSECVSPDDELPPEEEEPHVFQRPAASPAHVFALSTGAGSVAIVDPASLQIEAVVLPDEPVGLAVVPGKDAAVVLSRRGAALSYLARTEAGWSLATRHTPRRFDAVTLSPDGAVAVLWTPDGQVSDGGAEGIVGLADVAALAAGTPAPIRERAAGRRHTDVFFRMDGGAAADAVIVGQDEIAVVDLVSGAVESHLVCHGRGSDPSHSGYLERFSNDFGSYATSNGTYVTDEYYQGKYGLSLRVAGLDWSNNNAESRAIVIHNAWYAEDDMIPLHGMLGRSEGCFAMSKASQYAVMRRIAGGRMIFADKLAQA